MSTASNPQRTCIGCKLKRPQSSLLRVVVASDGQVIFSRVAAGRGAWLCNPPDACLELAEKRRGFDRALRQPIGAGALDAVVAEVATAAAARDDEGKES